jgi:(E)-4-hydroxy-3-methylbut-2-enyl-diphosphate synthase
MLNTHTLDTEACVEQAIRIIEAGGQLVRITAQGVKEAENLKNIRDRLRGRGYTTPLSADIHFTPEAAMVAARYVEKVRINPGNFADKRAVFRRMEYTEESYAEELQQLREKFTAFLDVCREHRTAVRIGTNHGSLSDRILNRYGNTPEGMAEATLEYLRICRDTGFRDVVISLKSSNCRIMVTAVRLLVQAMEREGMEYPLHLGVTEAGEGEDGRIRSAAGIGCLLNEGIGDTIRVSLTEAPEREIPVARLLTDVCIPRYEQHRTTVSGTQTCPFIVADVSAEETIDEKVTAALDFRDPGEADPALGLRLSAGRKAPEMIYTEALGPEWTKLPEETIVVVPYANLDVACIYNRNASPLMTAATYKKHKTTAGRFRFVELNDVAELDAELTAALKQDKKAVAVLSSVPDYARYRSWPDLLLRSGLPELPVIIRVKPEQFEPDRTPLEIAAHTAGLFIDRLAAGLWITFPGAGNSLTALELSRNILQSVGARRYKAEFVSCPGCGRTLYNLEEAVSRVKSAFAHLDRLKIAVMGCVVNGPGEMGDADYGYVGAGNGKVNLYKGQQMVKTAVPESEAVAALEQLIRENGEWTERLVLTENDINTSVK